MTDASAFTEKLRLLQMHYCRQLPQRIAALEVLSHQGGSAANAELLRHAHQLYGTAGSYGFQDISDAARQLEDALRGGASDEPIGMLCAELLRICKEHAHNDVRDAQKTTDVGLPLVVVVDDDPMIVLMLRKLLQSHARVQGGGSFDAALPYLKENPALILLDHQLEHGVDGLTILRLIRADDRYCHIPVVMITASEGADVKDAALKEGAQGYLAKPFVLPECIDYLSKEFLGKGVCG